VNAHARDIFTVVGSPTLRTMVRRAQSAGLETLLDYQRLSLLSAAVRHCKKLKGEFIELGTYRGGSAAVIGQLLRGSGKRLHLCDSFCGLPTPSAADNHR
jgi:hypothetical protein